MLENPAITLESILIELAAGQGGFLPFVPNPVGRILTDQVVSVQQRKLAAMPFRGPWVDRWCSGWQTSEVPGRRATLHASTSHPHRSRHAKIELSVPEVLPRRGSGCTFAGAQGARDAIVRFRCGGGLPGG